MLSLETPFRQSSNPTQKSFAVRLRQVCQSGKPCEASASSKFPQNFFAFLNLRLTRHSPKQDQSVFNRRFQNMEIVRFFGRAFARPETAESVKDPPSPGEVINIEEELKEKEKKSETEQQKVVLRRNKSLRLKEQVNDNSPHLDTVVDATTKKTYRFSQVIDSEIKKSHRISLCDFSVGIEVDSKCYQKFVKLGK